MPLPSGVMRFPRLAVVPVALMSFLALVGCDPGHPPGWTYVGGDEFNELELDSTRWRAYHNTYGDGNGELACLTPDNVTLTGRKVMLTARAEERQCPNGSVRQYTSAFLGSRDVGRYYPLEARFEMRGRLPHAQGLWPAFWLRHRNGASTAEVDVMEYFHAATPGRTKNALHFPNSIGTNAMQVTTPFEPPTSEPSGWHVWAVEIDVVGPTSVRFVFLLDGVETARFVDDEADAWMGSAPGDATWDIAVNLAVGGRWTGDPDGELGTLPHLNPPRCAQSGGTYPDCPTTGINRVDWSDVQGSSVDIDYVRVFTRDQP